jgi:hypothetical protein
MAAEKEKKTMRSFENFHYMRAGEFFMNAQPTSIAQDVREAIRRRNEGSLIDKDELRRQEDWSRMGNKVVGAEGGLIAST